MLKVWQKVLEVGREPPQAFYDQPELDVEMLSFLEAFRELGSERQLGMSIGPIPYSHIQRYANDLGLYGDAHERFCAILALVDVGYLNMIAEPKDDSKNKMRTVVTPDDPKGVSRMLKRMAKK